MANYMRFLNKPQSQRLRADQVANSAGGYAWSVDCWARLQRFLILGSEGGSYYATERDLSVENVSALMDCLQTNGLRTVATIVEVSQSGRAPKNDPAVFALAVALKLGDERTRQAASAAVPKVCRIGTHLFQLARDVQACGGWGRATRRAFQRWYRDQSDLPYQLAKYQRRHGWSHRDVLRKCHVPMNSPALRWAIGAGLDARDVQRSEQARVSRYAAVGELPSMLVAVELAKTAGTAAEMVDLIREYGLPRESVPTAYLNSPLVWDALLDNGGRGMPMTAMVRNLAKMTAVGLLQPASSGTARVCAALGDPERVKMSRIHPLTVLQALKVYERGCGLKGSLSWQPVPQVLDALDAAFYAAFDNVEPTGKRWLLGLDVSASMEWGNIGGSCMTPRVASAAMAMVTARTEVDYAVMAFSDRFTKLSISPRQRLDDVLRKTSGLRFGGTDCALPMLYALQHRLPVDVFVVYTDSETWHGNVHPAKALQDYRRKMGIPAKLIVVGMVANQFSIADPKDPGMLDVVGFDTAAPTVMQDFAVGKV